MSSSSNPDVPEFPIEALPNIAEFLSWETKMRLSRVSKCWDRILSASRPNLSNQSMADGHIEVRFLVQQSELTNGLEEKEEPLISWAKFGTTSILACYFSRNMQKSEMESKAICLLSRVPAKVIGFDDVSACNVLECLLKRRRLQDLQLLVLKRQSFGDWTEENWMTISKLTDLTEIRIERSIGINRQTGEMLLTITDKLKLDNLEFVDCPEMSNDFFNSEIVEGSEDGFLCILNRLRIENCSNFSITQLRSLVTLLLSPAGRNQPRTLEIFTTGVRASDIERELPEFEPYFLDDCGVETCVDWITDMDVDFRFEKVRILFQE